MNQLVLGENNINKPDLGTLGSKISNPPPKKSNLAMIDNHMIKVGKIYLYIFAFCCLFFFTLSPFLYTVVIFCIV